MVTKLASTRPVTVSSSVLAKIHMVTKLTTIAGKEGYGSVLAKIHMVTKRLRNSLL